MNAEEQERRLIKLIRDGISGGNKNRKYFNIRAYDFVIDALPYAARICSEKNPEHKKSLSGSELAAGICDFARELFGPLAGTVFKNWGFETTRDLGEAVYGLIDAGIFFADDKDKIEDFDNLFDIPKRLEE